MSASVAQWTKFLTHSLATRLEPETFESYVQILISKHPLSPSSICDLLLRPTSNNNVSLDPRIPRWVQSLLGLELVTVPAVLRALQKYSTFGTVQEEEAGLEADEKHGTEEVNGKHGHGKWPRWSNSYAMDETIFYRLAKWITSGSAPQNIQEGVELILLCTQWMELLTSVSAGAHDMLALGQAEGINAAPMALGTVVIAATENVWVLSVLAKGNGPKGMCKSFAKALAAFVPLLLQTSPQSAARLELFRTQTLVAIEPVDTKEKTDAHKEIDEILDETMNLGIDSIVVAELPIMNSRAGLYLYLNSLLAARPLIDDNALFGYLNNRYQGDIQTTTVDLILASFDTLANAIFRSEECQPIMRSFLINKLPLLLTTLSASMFPPLTPEYCITEALNHVDTNAFPTLSAMFDESSNNSMFPDSVRQDFFFACCLHGLIAESSIETLLGDIPMQSLPAGGRYVKEELVQQCLSDPERINGLIDELDHMDGNVGAVSQAIAEVMGRLCNNKETMSLKSLCGQLASKLPSLDVMLLFDKPSTILQPVCDILDNWHYDEDQGEYQPVYEEFGSILLLVLTFVHRYDLTPVDLGIRSSDSFVVKLLSQGHLCRALDSLSEQDQNHLDGWIKGLFDNESGGLGDELMSSCPPQDFFLLIPTLFYHFTLAVNTNNLAEEALKGGLEYFLDTFLLVSLIPGITWLAAHLWESRGDANAVLQILSALLMNPASIPNKEASQMLSSVLHIIAKPLEHSLRWLQRADPQRQDVEPLRKLLKEYGMERRGASNLTDVESWTSASGGGFVTNIKHTIASLVQWGLNPGINIMPASYTHRQILVALKLLGAKRLLQILVEEVKAQMETGNGSVIMDIATSLICAPDAASVDTMTGLDVLNESRHIQPLQRRMNLREALKIEAENAPKLHKTDAFTAETIIRLYRRVEAQLSLPQPSMMAHDAMAGLTGGLDDGLQGALDAEMQGALDGAMAGDANVQQSIDDVIASAEVGDDLMSGLMGAGAAGDMFGGQDLGDGMGF